MHQEDVEISVTIVIKQRDARTYNLRIIVLASHPVEMRKTDPGLPGYFRKQGLGWIAAQTGYAQDEKGAQPSQYEGGEADPH